MKPSDDQNFYIDGLKRRDRRVLSKTITLIESRRSDHRALAEKIVESILPLTGKAVRIGITGIPGVGKSTFIESFGMMLAGKGKSVAVLAVDPSSIRSGGSILADKTRMEALSVHPSAFIRPSPSGGTLGGVARMTREAMLVCEAAGFEVIIVETVGVGQSETEVSSMVDFFLVLLLAGAGDELQGIKKGILELADGLVINKSDGDNLERSLRTKKQYENILHLLTPASPNWKIPVLLASALEKTGLEETWETVMSHRNRLTETGEIALLRKKQSIRWMWSLIEDGLKERFERHPHVKKHLTRILMEVEKGTASPPSAVRDLFFFLDRK